MIIPYNDERIFHIGDKSFVKKPELTCEKCGFYQLVEYNPNHEGYLEIEEYHSPECPQK